MEAKTKGRPIEINNYTNKCPFYHVSCHFIPNNSTLKGELYIHKFTVSPNPYHRDYKQCESCGKLIKIKSKTKPEKYCDKCAIDIDREKAKERMKTIRNQ